MEGKLVRVEVTITLLVHPQTFTPGMLAEGIANGFDVGLTPYESPRLENAVVNVDGAVWEDETPILEKIEGWVA